MFVFKFTHHHKQNVNNHGVHRPLLSNRHSQVIGTLCSLSIIRRSNYRRGCVWIDPVEVFGWRWEFETRRRLSRWVVLDLFVGRRGWALYSGSWWSLEINYIRGDSLKFLDALASPWWAFLVAVFIPAGFPWNIIRRRGSKASLSPPCSLPRPYPNAMSTFSTWYLSSDSRSSSCLFLKRRADFELRSLHHTGLLKCIKGE
jgi:hypothetical protein